MRNTYVVSYDISHPKRLRRVFRVLRGFGDHLQLSVFRCEMNRRERIELEAALAEVIHHGEDQVMFADMGPAEGRGPTSITTLGRPFTAPERHAVVV